MMLSAGYMQLQKQLHAENELYGVSGKRYVNIVRELSDWGRLPILDYGCGRCTLSQALGPAYRVTNYDPCIDGLDTPPKPHDVVVCTDVMEHVEPEFVTETLTALRRLTLKQILFVISIAPATKTLADGRNAHISIHTIPEWLAMIKAAGFDCSDTFDDDGNYNTVGIICQ